MGAGLHFLVQLPTFLRLPGRLFSLTLGLHLPAVREVARLMGPRLLGVAVVQINAVVNAMLATSPAQPVGSLTAIKYAWAIMTMPQVVIAQAIAIAALPTFSGQFARGELSGMRASLAATLRGVILLALPATLGLILLREPLVTVLFQHGVFDARSTQLVSWALLWYTAGLVGHSVVEIVSRAFYAMHDTKTPVLVGTVAMSLNLAFSFLFSAWFERLGWMPHGGLALANSLATALEMVGLLYFMRRRLDGLRSAFQELGRRGAVRCPKARRDRVLAAVGEGGVGGGPQEGGPAPPRRRDRRGGSGGARVVGPVPAEPGVAGDGKAGRAVGPAHDDVPIPDLAQHQPGSGPHRQQQSAAVRHGDVVA